MLITLGIPNFSYAQEVTGLDGWTIFLDPGHSRTENQGLYNYSEAQKVLRVGLALREMLLTTTDIDTVYMSRMDDQVSVRLSQRTDRANALGADFFHSIHSDAGPSTANSTLLLHGGWRSQGSTVEKSPKGGKEMGDYMTTNLTAAMRIGTRGNYADRNFYLGGTAYNHDRQYPYLHVNRESSMASVLSEGGFHTNPRQQQLNMNAEYKRLEAQAHYWSILSYMGVAERPTVLQKMLSELAVAGQERTSTAEGFAEGAADQRDGRREPVAQPSAPIPQNAEGMGLIHQQSRVMGGAECTDRLQVGTGSLHAEEAFRHHHEGGLGLSQALRQVVDVVVAVAD